MATFLATHEPFLKTSAKLLILPMSSDGTVLDPILARTKSLYPSNYEVYRKLALDGQLMLGDILLHKVQKHITGLSAPTNHTADYIANLIVTHHAHHASELSAIKTALTALNPKLFDLVRYQGLKQVALFANPLFLPPTGNPNHTAPNPNRPVSPAQLWRLLDETLNLPRLRVSVYVAKSIDLTFTQPIDLDEPII